ncbi:winged helix-turn-helix domain-containing protein [Aquabacterium sp. OR-4]|uniref:winged helix-turn-helix domain-containing protein n=1 Tax=Aquabacterium sp. OR-4 TaxID=2978127 RepID=UPI0021B310E7|nr:response regulator transcription factor [Aquabacterium sp. OR-4]MDT7837360.1 response regulator transcription factor [Aquabacterium sp. OR-4]
MTAAVRTLPEPAPPPLPARVLVVDPDAQVQQWLAQCLRPHGHRVHAARHAEAIAQAPARGFELVMMSPRAPSAQPDWPRAAGSAGDAWQRLRGLRDAAPRLPVIVLQPHADATDRAVALELGADAVVDDDCGPRELRARVAALLRRHRDDRRGLPAEGPAAAGGWRLDAARRGVHAPDGTDGDAAGELFIALSASEFRLLRALMQQPGRPLQRADLLSLALGAAEAQRERSIDLLVSRLRRTLGDDPQMPRLIRTVRGAGYCFEPLIRRAGSLRAPMVSNASHQGDTGLTDGADDHITGIP